MGNGQWSHPSPGDFRHIVAIAVAENLHLGQLNLPAGSAASSRLGVLSLSWVIQAQAMTMDEHSWWALGRLAKLDTTYKHEAQLGGPINLGDMRIEWGNLGIGIGIDTVLTEPEDARLGFPSL